MGEVRWMFHATAMGPDYDGIFGPLAHLFGCRVLHRQQLPEPVGRDGGMTWIGDNSIEIGAPYGEGSSVANFVERLGGGMHSVAVQVADVDATLARLEQLGVEVSSRINREIVFTRSQGTAGLVLEWASHTQRDDPRWGAPVPAFVETPVVDVAHMAFVAALVRDPVSDAERLARVLDTDLVTYDHHDIDAPRHGLDLGDCMLALYAIPPDEATSRAVWGDVYDRPRCLALGLTVADRTLAERALAAEGFPVHHHTAELEHSVLVDGLPFPVVLCDGLLRGDPRLTSGNQEER